MMESVEEREKGETREREEGETREREDDIMCL